MPRNKEYDDVLFLDNYGYPTQLGQERLSRFRVAGGWMYVHIICDWRDGVRLCSTSQFVPDPNHMFQHGEEED